MMLDPKEHERDEAGALSRREFARNAACAAAAAISVPQLLAQEAAPAKPSETTPAKPADGAEAPSKLSAAAQEEVAMKYEALVKRYGARLSTEQKADARRMLASAQEGIEAVRAFPLENSVEPATIFRPLVNEGGK